MIQHGKNLERRTMRQLEVLTIFYAHAKRKGGRRTFPTMGDIAP
jgi:hypothetical protein